MEIEFERGIQDVIDFNLFHMEHSASARGQMLQSQVLTAMLTAVVAFSLSYALYRFITPAMAVITAVGGIAAFAMVPSFQRRHIRSSARKMLKEGNNTGFLGRQWISLSPEGIFARNQTSESKFNWSAVKRVDQDEKHIYLYTSSINALVIPLSCFKTREEKQEFLNYVNKYAQPQSKAA